MTFLPTSGMASKYDISTDVTENVQREILMLQFSQEYMNLRESKSCDTPQVANQLKGFIRHKCNWLFGWTFHFVQNWFNFFFLWTSNHKTLYTVECIHCYSYKAKLHVLFSFCRGINNIVGYLCLVRGILTQLAAATATKGTQRARRGGADWIINIILLLITSEI